MVEIQDGSYTYGDIQTYREHSNIKGVSKHIGGVQTWVHQNIQGVSKHMGACKHTGGIQMYGGIWILP